LPDSTRVCHAWRFSLLEAGCGSRIRPTRQRITVRGLCRDTDDSARTCRPVGAVPIVLHWLIASRGRVLNQWRHAWRPHKCGRRTSRCTTWLPVLIGRTRPCSASFASKYCPPRNAMARSGPGSSTTPGNCPALSRVIVFTRTKRGANQVADALDTGGLRVVALHRNKSQPALEQFRAGRARVLVATDLAARGIDVTGISHVINFDLPAQPEDYVHPHRPREAASLP